MLRVLGKRFTGVSLKKHIFQSITFVTIISLSNAASSHASNIELLNLSPVPSNYKKAISREQREQELSVRTRRSSSYDPQNIRMGEIIFAPSIETYTTFSDNVYGRSDNEREDIILGIKPELKIRSDLPLHQINARFYADDANYKKLKEEGYTDYGSEFDGRFDVYPGFAIPLSLSYGQQHSGRDDPDERISAEPTIYRLLQGRTGLRLTGDFIEINALTGFERYKYDDTVSFSGATIDNSSRDRDVFANTLSLGFPQTSIIAPFVYISHKMTSYDQEVDAFNISRGSDETETGIGSIFNFTPVTRSTFRIGQVTHNFDDPRADEIKTLTYSADLNWDASTLAAFSLSGSRGVEEVFLNSGAKIQTAFELGMTYELAPNILARPSIGYIEKEFEEFSEGKTTAVVGGMELTYKLNSNVWTTLQYNGISEKTESNPGGVGADGYDKNTITLSLKLQL